MQQNECQDVLFAWYDEKSGTQINDQKDWFGVFTSAGKTPVLRLTGNQRIVRLMTPIGMRYEDAYAKAHPFDKLVEGMMQPGMVQETAEIMRKAITDSVETNILINNRAGGECASHRAEGG